MSEAQTSIRPILRLLALCVFCSVGPAIAHAVDTDGNLAPGDPNDYVILSSLVTGQTPSVTVGDKLFSMFSYVDGGDMPEPADINVFGFEDPNGNFGISLHGGFIDLPGDITGSVATLAFNVGVTAAGQQLGNRISDAHLFLGGTGTGLAAEVSVDESFAGISDTLRVYASTIQPPNVLSDFAVFSETHSSLQVTAIITATAAMAGNQIARASVIDLTFSQTIVPEPSAVLLMLVGGAVSMLGRTRRNLGR